MRKHKQYFISITLTALLYTGFAAGGIAQNTNNIVTPESEKPVILSTSPSGGDANVNLNSVIEITFSNEMNENTINGSTFLLHATYADSKQDEHGEMQNDKIRGRSATTDSENSGQFVTGAVYGSISYSDKIAVFTPDRKLKENAQYTVTVTSGVKSSENIALEMDHTWSFTTMGLSDSTITENQNDRNRYDTEESDDNSTYTMSTNKSEEFLDLGKAANFVILANENVSNESGSNITGQIGKGSEAKKSKKDAAVYNRTRQTDSNQASVMQPEPSDSTSPDVNEAIEDMMSAYSEASMQNGDSLTTHNTESFHHDPALKPGVHEWSDSLHITSDVTLSGSADDVWLFKVNDNLTIDENIVFTLADGAQADNVFWFVEGEVNIGKDVQFEGIILSKDEITLEKGAKLNGRMFSQASITLDDNTVTEPRSMAGRTTSTNR